MTDHDLLMGLGCVENLNLPLLEKLKTVFGSLQAVCEADGSALEGTGLVTKRLAGHIKYRSKAFAIDELKRKMHEGNMKCVTLDQEEYPKLLQTLYDPPLALYYRGKLPAEDSLTMAIVGARRCTVHGYQTAKGLAKGIAAGGFTIVSGMARGIDSAAHQGALEIGRETIAVLGCGIDVCYPRENTELYYEIPEHGCLMSELPPGTAPEGRHFPRRNRLIAALSRGIIIVEAKKRSGSFITVEQGLTLGKDIYAVPGRPDDPLSEGCNALIREGARLITGAADVLDEYSMQAKLIKKTGITLDNSEKLVYASICLVPRSVDELSDMTRLSVSRVARILISLEMKGAVKQIGKNQYVLDV